MSEQIAHAADDARLDWWLAARFGLFIHWGAYAAAGVEASWPIMAPELAAAMFGSPAGISEAEYRALPGRFNPADFDAAAWVRTAQAAGMRYIIFTAKHHDGFCMFDAPGTEYKITRTPFGRDVCRELAQACAAAGMPLGFYYSPPDMHHPGYRDASRPATANWLGEPRRPGWAAYLDYLESHLRALLADYGPVAVLWFDGLTNHAKYDPPRFHRLIRDLSPATLVNDRLGDGYDFITPEQFIPAAGIPVRTGRPPAAADPRADVVFKAAAVLLKTPVVRGFVRRWLRQYADGGLALTSVPQEPDPPAARFQPWETCMTLGRTWAYNPAETAWKAPGRLVASLAQVAGRGGNLLLNVGPTGRGVFPPEALARLEHIGRWLARHGEAIYGSAYTPLQPPWGAATRKGQAVHLLVADWPADGRLAVDGFPWPASAAALDTGEPLAFRQDGLRLEIAVPAAAPDPDVSVVVVVADPTAGCPGR